MLSLKGALVRAEVLAAEQALAPAIAAGGKIELDLSAVTSIDSAGVALLATYARRLRDAGGSLHLVGARPEVQRTLQLFPFLEEVPPEVPERPGWFETMGERGLLAREVALQYLVLCADAAYFTVQGIWQRRGIRWSVVLYEMSMMGSKATGVVGLIAFLVGTTITLQSADQLRQFGANIFAVNLIGVSMTRELGPLMAAIVVAGRSGSAVAAELGTMMVSEEIDALKTLGLHPTRFLVVPKLLAITITQPLLTAMADAAGIFGGFLVCTSYLDIAPGVFLDRLQESLYLKDLMTGLVKSVVFAQLIVSIGALCGLRTKGGADAVGRSTTLSVVAGIFAVIVADAIASLIFYFGA